MIHQKHKILIGIDTGVNTGYCCYNRDSKKISSLATLKIHKAMEQVYSIAINNPYEIFVRVEDARLRKLVHVQKNEKWERGVAAGAGSVKRDAVIWEDFLTDLRIDFEMVAPKNNKTKVSDQFFKKLTGWQGRTSSHARDAALLVFAF